MTKAKTKLYYPYRDHKLAFNIIRVLAVKVNLTNEQAEITCNKLEEKIDKIELRLSTKQINLELSKINSSAMFSNLKIALERLVETGYVNKESIEHKKQTDYIWELSCLGRLASLTILHDSEFDALVSNYRNEKFYKMIYVLIASSNRNLVKLLLDRLNQVKNDKLEIENTAIKWYSDVREAIKKMHNNISFSCLDEFQKKIKIDEMMKGNMAARGKPDYNQYDTILTTIC